MGNDDNSPIEGYGGSIAGPIWAEFINRALEDKPARDFPVPSLIVTDVMIDVFTGLLATERCEWTELDAFIEGTVPTERAPCAIDWTPRQERQLPIPELPETPEPEQEQPEPEVPEEPIEPTPEEPQVPVEPEAPQQPPVQPEQPAPEEPILPTEPEEVPEVPPMPPQQEPEPPPVQPQEPLQPLPEAEAEAIKKPRNIPGYRLSKKGVFSTWETSLFRVNLNEKAKIR
jgi:membrane peptidoglycan carboxypeptidase